MLIPERIASARFPPAGHASRRLLRRHHARTASRRHENRRAARLAPRACFVRPRAVADSLAWWPHAARAALERAALDAGHVRFLVQCRAREEPAVPAARAHRQAGSAPEAGTRAPWSSNAARSKSHARVMVATLTGTLLHLCRFCPRARTLRRKRSWLAIGPL